MLAKIVDAAVWRKKLEAGGFRVISEPYGPEPASDGKVGKIECQACGTMYPSNSLCPCCG